MRYRELIRESTSIEAVINDPAFTQWFHGSQVVDANGTPLLCHHGTTADIDVSAFHPFTHFGTIGAAHDRLMKKNLLRFPQGASVIPVFLRITHPLDIPDLNTHMTPDRMIIAAKDILGDDLKRLLRLPKWRFAAEAARVLRERGIDGFRYTNTVEDTGSISWVILAKEQVWTLFGGGDLERIRSDRAQAWAATVARMTDHYQRRA